MGKFDPKKINLELIKREEKKEERMRAGLKKKKLLDVKRSKDGRPIDAVLLFGKHNGKKISELVQGFTTSSYVENYLLQNRDLPSKVRKTVSEIMQNFDPFDNEKELFTESGKKHYGDIVKEIFSEDDDEIPF